MKWPQELVLIRHAPSLYNVLKQQMGQDAAYQEFLQMYEQDPSHQKTRQAAAELHKKYPGVQGDMATPLAESGYAQSVLLGQHLRLQQDLPDVVCVSPYVRTWATLSGMLEGWPELAHIQLIEEERIREQEFGLRLLYSDWRFFFALHPDQQQLLGYEGAYWYRYPQGENIPDVRERNRSWMNSVMRDFTGKKVLAVTHHLNILAFRANMDRLNSAQFVNLDKKHKPGNCSISVYRGRPNLGTDGRFVLETYNQLLD